MASHHLLLLPGDGIGPEVMTEVKRVLAFLNIVGAGMRGPKFENNLSDMDPNVAADMAKRHPGLIVGIKTAHYAGPEWTPVEHAVEAGKLANIPVMVDFGTNWPQRPISVLLTQKLRPGDIYTHMYSGLRGEQDDMTLGPSKAFIEGRKRGIYIDAGTGGGSGAVGAPNLTCKLSIALMLLLL